MLLTLNGLGNELINDLELSSAFVEGELPISTLLSLLASLLLGIVIAAVVGSFWEGRSSIVCSCMLLNVFI